MEEENFWLLLGITFLSALTMSGPISEIFSQEMNLRAQNNKELFIVNNVVTCCLMFSSFLIMLIMGKAMEQGK